MSDSPVAQAAWIYEKLESWINPARHPEEVFGRDAILDNITMYWLTRSGGSSARLYWESLDDASLDAPISLPVAVTLFTDDVTYTPRRWAERLMTNITSWNEVSKGGHFATFEQPEIFTQEVRSAFRRAREQEARISSDREPS